MLPRTMPTPQACRYPKREGTYEVPRINWSVVDPLLRRCTGQSELTLLANAIKVSRCALHLRRRVLKLQPLPHGKRAVMELTPLEKEISRRVRGGDKQVTIATERGVSLQSIGNTMRKVVAKEARKARVCKKCEGAGVMPCGSDGEPICFGVPHDHICLECGGDGSYALTAGLTVL